MSCVSALYLMGVLFERGCDMLQQEEGRVQGSFSHEVAIPLSLRRFIMLLCSAAIVGACLFSWLEPLLTSVVLFMVKEVLLAVAVSVIVVLLVCWVRWSGEYRKQQKRFQQEEAGNREVLSRRVLYRDYREKFARFMSEYPQATFEEIMAFFAIGRSTAYLWRLQYKKEQEQSSKNEEQVSFS